VTDIFSNHPARAVAAPPFFTIFTRLLPANLFISNQALSLLHRNCHPFIILCLYHDYLMLVVFGGTFAVIGHFCATDI
jgi:hypothetical protein